MTNEETIVVHNPSDATVRDYPVQDPKTQDVALWSIAPGQTLRFPDYVANHLLDTYGFLQRVMTKEEYNTEQSRRKAVDQNKQFSPVKIVESVEAMSEKKDNEILLSGKAKTNATAAVPED